MAWLSIAPRHRWLLGGVLVSGLVLGVALTQPKAKVAHVTKVQRLDLTQQIVATGRVNAPARIDIGSEVTATLLAVPVREGQRVKAGEVLAQLADTEARAALSQAQASRAEAMARLQQINTVAAPVAHANLVQAELVLRNAEIEHRRTSELVAQGFYAQQRLDEAQRLRDTARSALAAAQTQAKAQQTGGAEVVLAQTRLGQAEAAVQASEVRVQRLRLTSPVDATVLSRSAEPGALAQPGKALFTLVPNGPSDLRIDVGVDEKNLSYLQPKLAAKVVADAYSAHVFDAIIDWISPAIDPNRGTVEVRLTLPQPPEFLRPDMTVSVNITVGQRRQVLVLDTGAVRGLDSPQSWVLAVRNGVATRVPVGLGLRGTGSVEITRGLEVGESVVLVTEKIVEGDVVQPTTTTAPVSLGGTGVGR